jgi:hypothetical protein
MPNNRAAAIIYFQFPEKTRHKALKHRNKKGISVIGSKTINKFE